MSNKFYLLIVFLFVLMSCNIEESSQNRSEGTSAYESSNSPVLHECRQNTYDKLIRYGNLNDSLSLLNDSSLYCFFKNFLSVSDFRFKDDSISLEDEFLYNCLVGRCSGYVFDDRVANYLNFIFDSIPTERRIFIADFFQKHHVAKNPNCKDIHGLVYRSSYIDDLF